MIKKTLLLTSSALLSMALITNANAEEKQNIYFGISGGVSIPLKNNFKITDKDERTQQEQTLTAGVKKSSMGTISLGYNIAEGTAIELSMDIKPKYALKLTLPNNYGSTDTKASANIYMVNLVYDLAKFGNATPYFTAGIGMSDVRLKEASITNSNITIFKLEKNHRKTVAYQIGLGVHYPIHEAISLDVSAKLQAMQNIKINYKTLDTTTGQLVDKSTKQHLGVGELLAGIIFNF